MGIVNKSVGQGIYDTWPYGAVKQIEILETKIVETSKHLNSLQDLLQKIPEKISDQTDPILREIKSSLDLIKNWNRHLLS
jgi:hypothetical protein